MLIVIPTRNRPDNVKRFYDSWKENTCGKSEIVLAVDEDDLNDYSYTGFTLECNPNLHTTKKINLGLERHLKDHKIVGFLGDDCTVNTKNFENIIEEKLSKSVIGILRPSNGFDKYDNLDHVFMTTALYKFLGWFAYPKIKHSFCDYVWRDIADSIKDSGIGLYHDTKDVVFIHYNIIYFPDIKKDPLHHIAYGEKNNAADRAAYQEWLNDISSFRQRMASIAHILMITHNRLDYLKISLPCLLGQDNKDFILTIWDNASNQNVLEYLDTIKDPRVKIIKNKTNDSLASVVSTVFKKTKVTFIGKVDPDTILPDNWLSRCIDAHKKAPLGVIGGFHFRPEDLEGITPRISCIDGVYLWKKPHIGGCAFIMRGKDFHMYSGEGLFGFTEFQKEKLTNGYLWNPILYVEHMEDSRSPFCIKNDEYQQYKLKTRGQTIEDYTKAMYIKNNYLRINAT